MQAPAIRPESRPFDRAFLMRYFVGAFGFTWALQLSITLLGLPFASAAAQVLYDLSILGPLLAAVACTATHSGMAGLRALFGRALQWRFSPIWYLMALGTVPALKLLSNGIHLALGGAAPKDWLVGSPGSLLFVLISQFGYVMFAEEVGWRALALPRLMERFGALRAALLLGVIHACWHLPMFLVPGSNQYGESFGIYLFLVVTWSLVMTFLYVRAKSALPCLLFHASLNVAAFVVGTAPGSEIYLWLLYGLLILLLIPAFPRPLFGAARTPTDGLVPDK